MNKKRQQTMFRSLIAIVFVTYCSLFVGSNIALAQGTGATGTTYKLLAPIPLEGGNTPTSEIGAGKYLEGMFKLIIGLAGVLAVVMIIYGGAQYMYTDAFGAKSEAKKTIENAVWGLLLAISSWLILNTINPNLVNFDLRIQKQELGDSLPNVPVTTPAPGTTPGTPSTPGTGTTIGTCVNCEQVRVSHKQPMLSATNCGRTGGCGCAYPGPCVIEAGLNSKLDALKSQTGFYVTEMYPPTRPHRNQCHNNGTCVDATISSATETNIKNFIEKADSANLKAVFETTTEKRAADIRAKTGLGTDRVYYVSGITGEHFSIYNK